MFLVDVWLILYPVEHTYIGIREKAQVTYGFSTKSCELTYRMLVEWSSMGSGCCPSVSFSTLGKLGLYLFFISFSLCIIFWKIA